MKIKIDIVFKRHFEFSSNASDGPDLHGAHFLLEIRSMIDFQRRSGDCIGRWRSLLLWKSTTDRFSNSKWAFIAKKSWQFSGNYVFYNWKRSWQSAKKADNFLAITFFIIENGAGNRNFSRRSIFKYWSSRKIPIASSVFNYKKRNCQKIVSFFRRLPAPFSIIKNVIARKLPAFFCDKCPFTIGKSISGRFSKKKWAPSPDTITTSPLKIDHWANFK